MTQQNLKLSDCHNFGWDRINFLHRSSHDGMILIFDDDSDANLLMSPLLMSSVYTKSWAVQLLMLSCQ